MHLIIGLGNPGEKYQYTRHNVGFSCIEYIRKHWDFPALRNSSSFRAEYTEGRLGTEKVALARPKTFMNRSGDAVRNISQFYKIDPSDIAVIHDDLDILLGEVRESFSSRSAGHNGVEDIIEVLRTKDFLRFRIGIKQPLSNNTVNLHKDTATFVLEPFSADELAKIEQTFPIVTERLRTLIENRRSE